MHFVARLRNAPTIPQTARQGSRDALLAGMLANANEVPCLESVTSLQTGEVSKSALGFDRELFSFILFILPMKNITIIIKPTQKALAVEADLLQALKGKKISPRNHIVITIGGDGTTLMAIKQYLEEQAAFVGISAGHLGFLQTLEPTDIPMLITALASNSFTTIHAPLLGIRYTGSSEPIGYAFNDITVERSGPRAARFDMYVDDNAGTFIGDGVIFATPLGSTAYSLAAGGPIIDSKAEDVMVVAPSNPHISSLYSSLQRPHVLQKDRIIRIEGRAEDMQERPMQLAIDGQVVVKKLEQPVEIYISDKTVSLLELKEKDFHSRIDKKRLGRY